MEIEEQFEDGNKSISTYANTVIIAEYKFKKKTFEYKDANEFQAYFARVKHAPDNEILGKIEILFKYKTMVELIRLFKRKKFAIGLCRMEKDEFRPIILTKCRANIFAQDKQGCAWMAADIMKRDDQKNTWLLVGEDKENAREAIKMIYAYFTGNKTKR